MQVTCHHLKLSSLDEDPYLTNLPKWHHPIAYSILATSLWYDNLDEGLPLPRNRFQRNPHHITIYNSHTDDDKLISNLRQPCQIRSHPFTLYHLTRLQLILQYQYLILVLILEQILQSNPNLMCSVLPKKMRY